MAEVTSRHKSRAEFADLMTVADLCMCLDGKEISNLISAESLQHAIFTTAMNSVNKNDIVLVDNSEYGNFVNGAMKNALKLAETSAVIVNNQDSTNPRKNAEKPLKERKTKQKRNEAEETISVVAPPPKKVKVVRKAKETAEPTKRDVSAAPSVQPTSRPLSSLERTSAMRAIAGDPHIVEPVRLQQFVSHLGKIKELNRLDKVSKLCKVRLRALCEISFYFDNILYRSTSKMILVCTNFSWD